MKQLKWLNNYLEEYILMVLLMLMSIIMGTQVFARYILNYSLSWSEEITRFLFIWSAFLSIGFCIKNDISIKVEQLHSMLKKSRYKKICNIINYTIEFIFFAYMIPFAWQYLNVSIASGQKSPASEIPMYYIQAAPLVGFTLATFRVVQKLVIELYNLRKG